MIGLGRHYQLDCRLLLPIRHWWTRSWSWNSSLRFVSSSCQLTSHLILKDLSLLSHLGLIWAVMLLSAAVAITLPIMTVILRLICSAGPQPTLMLLDTTTARLCWRAFICWASWATQKHSNGASDKSAPTRRLSTTSFTWFFVPRTAPRTQHPSLLLFRPFIWRRPRGDDPKRQVHRSHDLTAILALILVYMFSIFGYLFFLSFLF